MAGPTAVEGEFATLAELIVAAAAQIGDHEAFVDVASGQRLTFRQCADAAAGVAARLRELGVGRGDVVAVALEPSIDFAVASTAGALVGAVVTGVNFRLGPREIAGIVEKCRPAVVIFEAGLALPGDLFGALVLHRAELAAIAPGDITAWQIPPGITADDPAVIIWTSGTTGMPKGAWLDHRGLAGAVRTAGEMTVAFDRRISGIPMAHAGFMAKQWEQWAMGFALVLTPTPWTAAMMLEVLVTERITAGAGVPTQWAKLLDEPGIDEADLSALRICLAAAAPAAPELVERMGQVLGAPVVVRYAMTESPSISGTTTTDPPEVQYRTVGRPQDGVRLKLVDADGAEVAPGEVGRVCIIGPCVMRGYWNDPELTAAAFDADGWLVSGDLGRSDPVGNLVLVGRVNDMYIRGGYNVYPLEVENVLAEHPAVSTAAVIGVAAPVIGEIGVACVVAADPAAPPTIADLRGWVRERLADYKAPDELLVVDALPLTAVGKVDKLALKATLATRSTP
jgi:acyl-CoA synthetase (AMP-forming)/AMP-acid ligase II